MAYKLSQLATVETDPMKKAVMLGLAQEGLVSDIMSWRSINSLSVAGTRFDAVPSPAFIPLDGTISESTVDGKQISHAVYQMAHHIDIPRPLEEAGNVIEKPSVTQSSLAIKGAAYVINDQFINGDQGSDPNGFNRLNKFVGNLAAAQTVGSSQLDISGVSNHNAAIDRIHIGMHRVDGHMPTAGFANEDFLLRLESILRQNNLLGNDYDWRAATLEVDDPRASQVTASQRPAFMYRHVPFYDVGLKADQSTNIILNTYDEPAAASNDSTRLFFIKQAEDQLEGIQFNPLSVRKIGGLEAKDNIRWRLIWILGLALWGPRAVVKVQGLKVT